MAGVYMGCMCQWPVRVACSNLHGGRAEPYVDFNMYWTLSGDKVCFLGGLGAWVHLSLDVRQTSQMVPPSAPMRKLLRVCQR
jgi:hypothetical protein